jgi:hypothetical protein
MMESPQQLICDSTQVTHRKLRARSSANTAIFTNRTAEDASAPNSAPQRKEQRAAVPALLAVGDTTKTANQFCRLAEAMAGENRFGVFQ